LANAVRGRQQEKFPEVKTANVFSEQGMVNNAEVKNPWSYTSTNTYALMVCCLIKQSDNFTFHDFATTDPSY
jgi:hypothetical protein